MSDENTNASNADKLDSGTRTSETSDEKSTQKQGFKNAFTERMERLERKFQREKELEIASVSKGFEEKLSKSDQKIKEVLAENESLKSSISTEKKKTAIITAAIGKVKNPDYLLYKIQDRVNVSDGKIQMAGSDGKYSDVDFDKFITEDFLKQYPDQVIQTQPIVGNGSRGNYGSIADGANLTQDKRAAFAKAFGRH